MYPGCVPHPLRSRGGRKRKHAAAYFRIFEIRINKNFLNKKNGFDASQSACLPQTYEYR